MEKLNKDKIFTLPLLLACNPDDGDSVNGLPVDLSDASNVVQKTLLVYQDTCMVNGENGHGQPVVRFLCEVDENNEEHSIDSCTDAANTNGSTEGSNETMNLSDGTCWYSEGSEAVKFRGGEREIGKVCEEDLVRWLETFIQTVVVYQCRLCQHTCNDKAEIVKHLRSFHLINNTAKQGMLVLQDGGSRSWTDSLTDIKRERVDDERLTVYMCGQCSLPFETMAECKSHMSNHSKSKSGNKVNNVTKKEREWRVVENGGSDSPTCVEVPPYDNLTQGKHCPDLTKQKSFKCSRDSCGLEFSTQDLMSLHWECHSEEGVSPPYKCCRCHFIFNRWSELVLHLWKSHHIDLDLFNCSVCTFKSVSRLELRRHFKNHAVGEFYCTICGMSFVEQEPYHNHCLSLHSIDNTLEEKKKKKKVEESECSECGLKLSSAKALKKHVTVVHGKLRPYVCQVCPFTSSTLATLRLHLRQHTGETPFTCDHCPFKTRDHNTMRRHRMRHSFVKPYSCKHCQFSSVQSTQLKNHILKFHPESTDVFECPDCTFATLSQSLIVTHRKVHHRDGRWNKVVDQVDRDRNLSSMFPSSKSKGGCAESGVVQVEDEESSSQCYFESEQQVDTGGITIPAEEMKPEVKCSGDSQLSDPGGCVRTGAVLVPNEDTMPLS